jgi:hypothetical protein
VAAGWLGLAQSGGHLKRGGRATSTRGKLARKGASGTGKDLVRVRAEEYMANWQWLVSLWTSLQRTNFVVVEQAKAHAGVNSKIDRCDHDYMGKLSWHFEYPHRPFYYFPIFFCIRVHWRELLPL